MGPDTEGASGARPTHPCVAEVDRIAGHPDEAIRNLQITLCYHELSAAVARWVGPTSNWCTYAVWASKQAGQTIRQEDLVRTFEDRLGTTPEFASLLDSLVRGLARRTRGWEPSEIERIVQEAISPQAAFDRASEAISRGNWKVFDEIGREFARFLETFRDASEPDEGALRGFCDRFRPGEPPDGQGHLKNAFFSLYRARFATDPKTRAELILRTNLEIGFHEQTRLQPEIEAGLEAPVVDARRTRRLLLSKLFPRLGKLGIVRPWLALYLRWTTPLERFWGGITELARKKARLATTELLMTLNLPGGERLLLGGDLRAEYPESVKEIRDPELSALLARLDPDPDGTHGSGADDWTDFPQRMHYITDFFRAYQERSTLLAPPFDAAQAEAIRQGQRPGGRL